VHCELIDGALYDMAPAPSVEHQRVVLRLAFAIEAALRGGAGQGRPPCEVLPAPMDVVLAADSVVQPDLSVVCDRTKTADGRFVAGAPDLVIEVLSPSTAVKDRREKRRLYESAGVCEYLTVSPDEHYAEYYRLGPDHRYGPSVILGPEDTLQLQCVPGFAHSLADLFGWSLPHQVREPPPLANQAP
jgi:Uma2 family endonuclease